MLNFSTGRIINKAVFDSEVSSMDHDHTGQLIFCGDSLVSPGVNSISLSKLSDEFALPLWTVYWGNLCRGVYIL